MNIEYTKGYDEMSQIGAKKLAEYVKNKPNSVICIATGSSPTGMYKKLVNLVKEEKIDVSKLTILKLDEWCGLEKTNRSTCEYYIIENILNPLNITLDRYISFNPLEKDAEKECKRIEEEIYKRGGIDFCVLGIGKNGHLGLNEPGEYINPFIHRAILDEKTKTHSMLQSKGSVATTGYTIGIKDILNSKEILFLVTGDGKEEAFENFKTAKISTQYPSNFLWLHHNVNCIVNL